MVCESDFDAVLLFPLFQSWIQNYSRCRVSMGFFKRIKYSGKFVASTFLSIFLLHLQHKYILMQK